MDAVAVEAGVGAGAGGEVGEDGGGRVGGEPAFWVQASMWVQEVSSTATQSRCPTMRSRSNRIKESF